MTAHSVCIFGIEDGRLSTKNEVVSLGTQSNRDATTEEDESKDISVLETISIWSCTALHMITHLLLAFKEKVERVVSIWDGRADNWKPVENDGRVRGSARNNLFKSIRGCSRLYDAEKDAYKLSQDIKNNGNYRRVNKEDEEKALVVVDMDLCLGEIGWPFFGGGECPVGEGHYEELWDTQEL